jgi:hypothetical protein
VFVTNADLEVSLRIEAQIEYGAVVDLYVFKLGVNGREIDITDCLTPIERQDLSKWALDEYHKKNKRTHEAIYPDPMDEVDRLRDYDMLRAGGDR